MPFQDDTLSLSGPTLAELMQAVLEKSCRFRFSARGGSMVPFIHDGDILTLAPLAGRRPQVGAVVAYRDPDGTRLVVHRVVRKDGRVYHIMGDGRGCTTELVSQEDILGQVVQVERAGRRVRLGLGAADGWLVAWSTRIGLLWRVISPVYDRLRKILHA